tara:strand:- start:297 stop:635 length:339 start_codon:yes stop_codon:yes gene_type:complete
MGLRDTVELGWNGEKRDLILTTAIMVKVEQKAVSPLTVLNQISQGEMPIASIASILSVLFNEAGLSVSTDEIFDEIFEDEAAVMPMAMNILGKFMPKPKKKVSTGRKGRTKK